MPTVPSAQVPSVFGACASGPSGPRPLSRVPESQYVAPATQRGTFSAASQVASPGGETQVPPWQTSPAPQLHVRVPLQPSENVPQAFGGQLLGTQTHWLLVQVVPAGHVPQLNVPLHPSES